MKFILIVFLFLYPIPYTLYPTYAAESTPSASIQSQLEQLKQAIASKAAKLKSEISQKLQNKAYVGIVKLKSENTLTLASKSDTKIVNISEDTIFKAGKNTKFSLKTLQPEDSIAALGEIDDTLLLHAKRIVLLKPLQEEEQKTYLWGQIVSNSERLLTVKKRSGQNIALTTSSKTEIKKGDSEIASADLKPQDIIIATGYVNKKDILEANFIYVISGKR